MQNITVMIPLDAASWAGNAVTQRVYRAPEDGQGGGVTLKNVYVVNEAATTSGTAFALALLNYGTGGAAVKSSGGTIGSVGGTADVFAAGTPKEMTISNTFVDAGEWLVLSKTETNSSDPTRGMLMMEFEVGR